MEFITDVSIIVSEAYFKDPGQLEKILRPYRSEKRTSGYKVSGTFEELENLVAGLSEARDRAGKPTRPQGERASPGVEPVDVSGVVMKYIQQKRSEELSKIHGSSFSIDVTAPRDSRGAVRVLFRSSGVGGASSSPPVRGDFVRQRFVTFYQRTASDLEVATVPAAAASPRRDPKDLRGRFPDILFEPGRDGDELTATGPFVQVARLKEFLSQSAASSRKSPTDGRTSAPAPSPERPDEDPCPICMEPIEAAEKDTLRCKHSFCRGCLKRAFDYKPVCPTCGELYGVLTGTQPDGGEMKVSANTSSLPGYEKHGTIVIRYYIPSGVQKEEHPNPGQPYEGASRTCYLPDSSEGRRILALLRRAFDQKLVFTVGRSTTRCRNNMVTWNDIHHKTSPHGGPTHYGYPDADYLSRVEDELKVKGIE